MNWLLSKVRAQVIGTDTYRWHLSLINFKKLEYANIKHNLFVLLSYEPNTIFVNTFLLFKTNYKGVQITKILTSLPVFSNVKTCF